MQGACRADGGWFAPPLVEALRTIGPVRTRGPVNGRTAAPRTAAGFAGRDAWAEESAPYRGGTMLLHVSVSTSLPLRRNPRSSVGSPGFSCFTRTSMRHMPVASTR